MKKEFLIITLLLIIYLTTLNEPENKKINETITGDYIKITGNISEYYQNRITSFKLTDETGSIKVIFFNELNGWNGQKAEIIGRINEYKGEKELTGVKIKNLR